MKRTIVCLVGDSGSGKTLASLYLQKTLGWNTVVSYTTRPMRDGETNGKEHWFVDKSAYPIPDQSNMCAYTKFGGHEYWTEWKQFLDNKINVYVIDEKGLINLRSKEQTPFSFNLVTIRINRQNKSDIDSKRLERDNGRASLPDELYDYIINNDFTIESFKTALYLVAKAIETKYNYGSTKR